jgi:hypothetical protein
MPSRLGPWAFFVGDWCGAWGGVRDMRAIVVMGHYKKPTFACLGPQEREEIDFQTGCGCCIGLDHVTKPILGISMHEWGEPDAATRSKP